MSRSDNRDCLDESVKEVLYPLEDVGQKQYQEYVKGVLQDRTRSVHDPIQQNSLALFKRPKLKELSKLGKRMKILQNYVALFGKLYIAMQSRDSNLKDFFSYEIQPFPPFLSELGKSNLPTNKSDVIKCLQPSNQPEQPSFYDCKVRDGAVIVHCLPTAGVRTFNDYAEEVFVPYLRMQLRSCTRLDVVWDTYLPESLKDCTQTKRGKCLRRKVSGLANYQTVDGFPL